VPAPWHNGTEQSYTFSFQPAVLATFAVVVNQVFPQTDPRLQRASIGAMAAFAPPPPPPSPPPPRWVLPSGGDAGTGAFDARQAPGAAVHTLHSSHTAGSDGLHYAHRNVM
jgi:hypothetical protein